MNKLWCFLSLLLLWGCDKEENRENVIRFADQHSPEMLNALSFQFIPLETTSDNLISGIQQIEMDSTRIYLMDSRSGKVFVFGKDGKFISGVGI